MFRRQISSSRVSSRAARHIAEASAAQGGAARAKQSSTLPVALGLGAASALAVYTVFCYNKDDTVQLREKDSLRLQNQREAGDQQFEQPRLKSQMSVVELAKQADRLPNHSATIGVKKANEASQIAHDRATFSDRLEDRFNPLHLSQKPVHPRELDARGHFGDTPARIVEAVKAHNEFNADDGAAKQKKDLILNNEQDAEIRPRRSLWGKTKSFFSKASDDVEEKAHELKERAQEKFNNIDKEDTRDMNEEYRRKADHE